MRWTEWFRAAYLGFIQFFMPLSGPTNWSLQGHILYYVEWDIWQVNICEERTPKTKGHSKITKERGIYRRLFKFVGWLCPAGVTGEVQLIWLMETISLWGGRKGGGGLAESVCRLFLIPASLSEMIWEIILIILNAITVSPTPLPPLSPCRIKSMCHSMWFIAENNGAV